jgi:ribosomal subunit interface protein
MEIVIKTKNVELTESLEKFIKNKIGKLDKFFHSDTEIFIEIEKEAKHHRKGEVFFAEADNALSFAETIEKAAADRKDAQGRAERAYAKVLAFTWDARAKRIISFMNHACFSASVFKKTRLFFLARFLCAGLLAFAVNISLLFILKEYFHIWYLYASTYAFIISVIASFLAQKFITFRDRSRSRVAYQLTLYVIIALLNVVVNGVLMFSFVDVFHIPYLISQICSAALIALWSLAAYRFIIFRHVEIH